MPPLVIEPIPQEDDEDRSPEENYRQEERSADLPIHNRRWYRPERRRRRRRRLRSSSENSSSNSSSSSISSNARNNRVGGNWRLGLGTFLINLILPGIITSFGVFMLHMSNEIPVNLMFIIPVINIVFCTLSEPLCRYCLYHLGVNHNYLLAIATMAIFIVVFNKLNHCIGMMIATYGFFAGFGSGMLMAYATETLAHHFPAYRGMTMALNYVATATGYIIMPMGIHMLMETYNFGETALFQGMTFVPILTIAATSIPAWRSRPSEYYNGSTIGNVAEEDRRNRSRDYLMQNLGTTWRNPNTGTILDSELNYDETALSERKMTRKHERSLSRAKTGSRQVIVMPQIVEDGEGELQEVLCDEGTCINKEQEKLQGVNEVMMRGKQDGEEDQFEMASETNDSREDPAEPMISRKIRKDFYTYSDQSAKPQNQVCVRESCQDSYVKQFFNLLWETIFCPVKTFIVETSVISLSTPFFFPALWTKFSLRFCSMTFTTMLPTLSMAITPTNTREMAMSGLITAAFAGLFTLIGTPFFRSLGDEKQKYILSLGSLVEGIGFYVLTVASNSEYLQVGCVLCGIGLSMSFCSIPFVIRKKMGVFNHQRTALAMDILCAVLISFASLTVLAVWKASDIISDIFYVLMAIQAVSAVVWIIRPCFKLVRNTPLLGREDINSSPTHC